MIINVLFDTTYSWQDKFIAIVAIICALLGAVILHELAHGVVAYWNGDKTAKEMGRLTLNPIKHFNPFGFILMLVVGLGWANPVPVNPYNFKNRKCGWITTAIAGVSANLILAFTSFGLNVALIAISEKVVITHEVVYIIFRFFNFLFVYGTVINISLIAFNLLPIYPLDGFRVVETLTPPNNGYVRFMRKYSRYIFLGLIVIGNTLGRYISYFDILGTYIGWVQKGVIALFNLVFGG